MLPTATGSVIPTMANTATLGASRVILTVTRTPATMALMRSDITAAIPMITTAMDDGTKGARAINRTDIPTATFINSRSAARVEVTHME